MYSTELFEMMIEGKCLPDVEVLHDNFACAIRKTPILIVEAREDFICQSDVRFSEFINISEPGPEETLGEQECTGSFAASPEQR